MANPFEPTVSAQSIGTQSGGDFWWGGGSSTATGSVLGNFWNEISGTNARNNFNAEQALLSREFNSAEAQKNRDWQEMMSNTAYQRQVEDMKKAGINPAAAMLGSGASTPSGSTASSAAAQSSSGGSGGFLAPLMTVAGNVLGKVAYAKIMQKAMSARDVSTAANVVQRETMRAQSAMAVAEKRGMDARDLQALRAQDAQVLEKMRANSAMELQDARATMNFMRDEGKYNYAKALEKMRERFHDKHHWNKYEESGLTASEKREASRHWLTAGHGYEY